MPVGPLSRRRLLGLGVALPLLTACTPGLPTVTGPSRTPASGGPSVAPSSSPSPTPTPTIAGARTAATTELALAGLAAAIRASPGGRRLTADQRTRLAFVAQAHRDHAAALDPTATAGRPANVSDLSGAQALTRLARAETAAAGRHRAAALAVSGDDALGFGSAAAAAGLYARTVAQPGAVPTSPGPRTPPRLARGTDVEAVQALVAQLHALVYGYQLAAGRMPVAGPRDDQAAAELLRLRLERDRLIGWLRRREAEVPVPEPAYKPTVEVRDGPTGIRLVRTMLVALAPFAGIWLAAAGDPERAWALSFFGYAVDRARGWGAPLPIWPGS